MVKANSAIHGRALNGARGKIYYKRISTILTKKRFSAQIVSNQPIISRSTMGCTQSGGARAKSIVS